MKFNITDEDGNTTVVEEFEEEAKTTDEEPEEEIVLSKEDILALKSLIPHIDKIKALVEAKEEVSDDEEEKEVVGEEVEKEIHNEDEDEEIDEDEDEEIIDTDEDEDENKIHDSIGSIGNKKASTKDALDAQLDLEASWAKRYNGGKK